MEKEVKYIVSACLAGFDCRYDCKNNENDFICQLVKEGRAIPVCPEQLGGLPTPRDPSEIKFIDGKRCVISKNGNLVTKEFERGGEIVLGIAKKYSIRKAILQERSPSCGLKTYDGTFSKTLTNNPGITAQILIDNGIEVISSEKIKEEV